MNITKWGLGIWGLAQSPIPNPQSPYIHDYKCMMTFFLIYNII